MWKLKLFISLLFLLAVASAGMVISANNSGVVSPKLFGLELYSASLGIWLFIALLLGGLLGYLVAFVGWFKNKSHSMMLARKLKSCEKELAQLRTASFRD